MLTENKRSDPRLFEFCRLITTDSLSLQERVSAALKEFPLSTKAAGVTLCLSHKKRMAINQRYNTQAYEKAPQGCVWIKANKKQRTTLNPPQDFWCYAGQVLLVSTPRSREQLYNGQFVTVVSVSAHLVRVRGQGSAKLVTLSHALAGSLLRPSHSITYASCQGCTFANQIVRLLDVRHHCFTARHLLVGLSRASSASLVECGL